VLRSRIIFMRLRLRVKILMRLRLLPHCIARAPAPTKRCGSLRLRLRNTGINRLTGKDFLEKSSQRCVSESARIRTIVISRIQDSRFLTRIRLRNTTYPKKDYLGTNFYYSTVLLLYKGKKIDFFAYTVL
jgi:hypothetical protein